MKMIYLQFVKTYTAHSILAHKGQHVKAVQQFRNSVHWYTWAMAINKNDTIDFMVSDFEVVNRKGVSLY
tara:strand:+ start:192 stop:398 length:207 start_codon:yes stop_codon:yes gene_type:complete